jgi:uncharacterized protein YggU (UPF0235/DUF167 family)
MLPFFSKLPDGLRIFVKAQPGASDSRIEEVLLDPSGQAYLRVRVAVPPEKGKANKAIASLLAEAWEVPVSSLTLEARAASRFKVFHLRGNPDHLEIHLTNWMKAHGSKR